MVLQALVRIFSLALEESSESIDNFGKKATQEGHCVTEKIYRWMLGAWKWICESPYVLYIFGFFAFVLIVDLVANWKLVKKTGNLGISSLLFYVPCANLILWLQLAFGEWPKRRS